jgi:hypothetical protein
MHTAVLLCCCAQLPAAAVPALPATAGAAQQLHVAHNSDRIIVLLRVIASLAPPALQDLCCLQDYCHSSTSAYATAGSVAPQPQRPSTAATRHAPVYACCIAASCSSYMPGSTTAPLPLPAVLAVTGCRHRSADTRHAHQLPSCGCLQLLLHAWPHCARAAATSR